MDRKKITAMMIGCEPGEFLAYCDLADQGTVVVGPDGKKYRFNNAQLEEAEASRASKTKPKPPSKSKSQSKAKPRKKPATKTGAKLQ